jgi:hypothetical protein
MVRPSLVPHIPDRQIVEGKDDITREQARLLRRTIAPWINDQDTAGTRTPPVESR